MAGAQRWLSVRIAGNFFLSDPTWVFKLTFHSKWIYLASVRVPNQCPPGATEQETVGVLSGLAPLRPICAAHPLMRTTGDCRRAKCVRSARVRSRMGRACRERARGVAIYTLWHTGARAGDVRCARRLRLPPVLVRLAQRQTLRVGTYWE